MKLNVLRSIFNCIICVKYLSARGNIKRIADSYGYTNMKWSHQISSRNTVPKVISICFKQIANKTIISIELYWSQICKNLVLWQWWTSTKHRGKTVLWLSNKHVNVKFILPSRNKKCNLPWFRNTWETIHFIRTTKFLYTI